MNYEKLLELAVELAYRLQCCGAETYRVEESILRLLDAYGVPGEAFSIPNCIIASLETPEHQHITRMRRTKDTATDMDGIEQYNALCRRLCMEHPPLEEAYALMDETQQKRKTFSVPVQILGHSLAAIGYSFLFRGSPRDAVCGGICGVAVGFCSMFMSKLRANLFFKTVACGFVLAGLAQILAYLGLPTNVDASIIGTLMLLVPGLLFANSIRDVIYGDTMSGVNRLVQVFIIAIAIAVGTGAAVSLTVYLWGEPKGTGELMNYGLFMQCIATCIGDLGFCLLFNLRRSAIVISMLGGVCSWVSYRLFGWMGMGDVVAFLLSAIVVATYAETMARVMKGPAIAFMLVSIIPLIPGSNIYYTTVHVVHGDIDAFLDAGLTTAALSGALAVGMLIGSSLFRMWGIWKRQRVLRLADKI